MPTKKKTQSNALSNDFAPRNDGVIGIEEEETTTGGEITEPFDPSKLRVESRILTIDLITTRIKQNEIDLSPEFQRKGGIWKDPVQSRLIESLIISIPIPAFYFDATNEESWLVVDGLQRLFALKRFIIEQDLILTGLEFLTELNGKKFTELPRKHQRKIQETQFITYLIQQGTPPEAKFNIFKRINTGGLPLSTQEIRHALNQRKATAFLKKLAESEEFLIATDNGMNDERMADRECVLRFLAFTIMPYSSYKIKDFDKFLNDCMMILNSSQDLLLADLERRFLRAMMISYDLFGILSFRKISIIDGRIRRQPINKALFEAWSVNLAKLKAQEIKQLLSNKKELMKKYIDLLAQPGFINAITLGTGEVKKVKTRFEEIESLIREVLS